MAQLIIVSPVDYKLGTQTSEWKARIHVKIRYSPTDARVGGSAEIERNDLQEAKGKVLPRRPKSRSDFLSTIY